MRLIYPTALLPSISNHNSVQYFLITTWQSGFVHYMCIHKKVISSNDLWYTFHQHLLLSNTFLHPNCLKNTLGVNGVTPTSFKRSFMCLRPIILFGNPFPVYKSSIRSLSFCVTKPLHWWIFTESASYVEIKFTAFHSGSCITGYARIWDHPW